MTDGSAFPKGAPPDLVAAIDLFLFGGPARLTWTEYQNLPQPVLDYHAEVVAAYKYVKERRGS